MLTGYLIIISSFLPILFLFLNNYQQSQSLRLANRFHPSAISRRYPMPEAIHDDDSSIGSEFPPDAESLLQEEMMKLSLKDRNDFQEEIHGVQCLAREESPEVLREYLYRLDVELNNDKVPSEQRKHYLKSQELFAHKNKPTYVNTDEFRLRFLRCVLFDVTMAALRINKYLGLVDELFGEFSLQRPIRISDFSKVELREFRKGRYQFMPYRDRAGVRGRRILSVFPDQHWENMSTILRTKIWLYLTYVAGDDIEAQKHGIVVLVWFDNAWKNVSKQPLVSNQSTKVFMLGVRASSIHICTPDTPKFRFRRSIMIMRLGKERSRVKIHVGTNESLVCHQPSIFECFLPMFIMVEFVVFVRILKITSVLFVFDFVKENPWSLCIYYRALVYLLITFRFHSPVR